MELNPELELDNLLAPERLRPTAPAAVVAEEVEEEGRAEALVALLCFVADLSLIHI